MATVVGQGLRGRADRLIADVCRTESRVLLSLDLDFADIRSYPPSDHAGIVVCRLGSQSRAAVNALIERLLPSFDRETLTGRLWIVDESGIRVRGGE